MLPLVHLRQGAGLSLSRGRPAAAVLASSAFVFAGAKAGAQPAADTKTVPVAGKVVVVTQADPGPNDPGRCIAVTFLRFPNVTDAISYSAVVNNVAAGHQSFGGPPFQDDYKEKGYSILSFPAPGGHQLVLGSYSTGAGCADAKATAEGRVTLISLTALVKSGPKQVVPAKPKPECEICPPTLGVDASATTIDPSRGGSLQIRATIHTAPKGAIKNARLSFEVTPNVNVHASPGAVTVGSVPEKSTRPTTLPPIALEPVVTRDGDTLAGMNRWTSNGWTTDRARAAPAGGDLVFSDSPEYLAATTVGKNGEIGPSGEGVLYRQRGATRSGVRSPDFRVYFNHENRTGTPRALCILFTSPTGAAVTVTPGPSGLATRYANPVAAGKLALLAYEQSRRDRAHGSALVIPAAGAAAECVTTIGQKQGLAEVANGIFDFTAGSPVQVGIVAVKATRANAFEMSPLTFHFIDEAHPQGNPARTYETDESLHNAGESHVNGTFGYNEVDVSLPAYGDGGPRLGVRLAGKIADLPAEYRAAVDTGKFNLGNYGVIYNVTVASRRASGEDGQVLLNPRAVGPERGGERDERVRGAGRCPGHPGRG